MQGISERYKVEIARGQQRESELKQTLVQQSLDFERRVDALTKGAFMQADHLTQQLLDERVQLQRDLDAARHSVEQHKAVLRWF
jgi:hypothetical protein